MAEDKGYIVKCPNCKQGHNFGEKPTREDLEIKCSNCGEVFKHNPVGEKTKEATN